MGYYLTIDQGNSSAKVVVWHNDEPIGEHYFESLSVAHIESLINIHGIDAAIYCSVAAVGTDIMNSLSQKCHLAIELTHLTPMPITIGYATPHTLGRDRIATAVGAQCRFPGTTVLVVDMGTAVTYDVVDSNACFIGGNIAPGVNMRLEAMHHFTARLPIVDPNGDLPTWGYDTTTAMRAGAINGVVAEIEHYYGQLPAGSKVIITGGWAQAISPLLSIDHEIDPLLVNRGLNCILRYNETK